MGHTAQLSSAIAVATIPIRPRQCEQRGDVPVNQVRNECQWILHPPSSHGSHFVPFFVPLQEKKMDIRNGAHVMSQWPRKECSGKAWRCANDAEPGKQEEMKRRTVWFRAALQPQFFPFCAPLGSLGTWDCLELDHRRGSFCLRRQWVLSS